MDHIKLIALHVAFLRATPHLEESPVPEALPPRVLHQPVGHVVFHTCRNQDRQVENLSIEILESTFVFASLLHTRTLIVIAWHEKLQDLLNKT